MSSQLMKYQRFVIKLAESCTFDSLFVMDTYRNVNGSKIFKIQWIKKLLEKN